MKVFEMFAGVGGFSQGFPKDWEIVGFSEIDKYASQVLKYHYPNVKNYGNCQQIKWEQIPDFDILTGGSPCQDFSIAGKRRGLAGSKSSLAWEFIRGLRDKKPKYFIWENVKGVMSSRGGWDFANLLTAFSESGYSLWWQVLNAKDFGVPQNRERIFVIGFREGSPKEVFFESENSRTAEIMGTTKGEENTRIGERDTVYGMGGVMGSLKATDYKQPPQILVIGSTQKNSAKKINESTSLTSAMGEGGGHIPMIKVLNKGESQHYRLYDEKGLAPTLQSQSGMSSQKHPFIVAPNKKEIDLSDVPNRPFQVKEVRTEKGKETRKEIRQREGRDSTKRGKDDKKYIPNNEDVANCLTTSGEQIENWTFENNQVRKLMPIECERLMSWKDNWTKYGIDDKGNKIEISDSQRYKMAGNGVVSNVVRELIKALF